MPSSAKENVINFIRNLPDDISEEEITYHLYVREKVQKAREHAREGKLHTQEEIKEIVKKLHP